MIIEKIKTTRKNILLECNIKTEQFPHLIDLIIKSKISFNFDGRNFIFSVIDYAKIVNELKTQVPLYKEIKKVTNKELAEYLGLAKSTVDKYPKTKRDLMLLGLSYLPLK